MFSSPRHEPTFSSELLAAYRAVRPVLIREQRPWAGGLVCLASALAAGYAVGRFVSHGGLVFPILAGCFIGILCGGFFRLAGRPIESKWRMIAVLCAWLGVLAGNLTWSHAATRGWTQDTQVQLVMGESRMPTRFGFIWPLDLVTLAAAGWTAWHFSFRMPTQSEIIQRARQLAADPITPR